VDWLFDLSGTVLGLAASCLPFLYTRRLAGLSWHRGARRRPHPGAPLILVADPHWGGQLTGLRRAQAAHPDADWLFLGDVFDVWVGVPGMETPLEREFLAWVQERRRDGRWVGLWLGNREYFLDGLADRFDLMGEGIGGGLPEEGLAWEHGDLVNRADWPYRLWNLVSRSGPVWLLARALPRSAARSLAQSLQKALHTTNRSYKLAFPRGPFRAAAAEHPSATFLTGHFHVHEREGNGIALPWAHEGEFMVWRDGQVQPLELPDPSRKTE
jgi:UDP-2,3-diacylglucosamine pyrophosphatase LpxH